MYLIHVHTHEGQHEIGVKERMLLNSKEFITSSLFIYVSNA